MGFGNWLGEWKTKGRAMGRTIQDEFSELRISGARKWVLRNRRDNRCAACGRPVVSGGKCLKHLVAARELQRKWAGYKRGSPNSMSYRIQDVTEVRQPLKAAEERAVKRLPIIKTRAERVG